MGKLIVPTHPKDATATCSPVTRSLVRNVHNSEQASCPGACGTSCPTAVSNKPTGAAFLCLEDRPSLVRQVNISHLLQTLRQPVCQVPDSLPPCAPSSPAFQLSFVSCVTAQIRALCCPVATLRQELKASIKCQPCCQCPTGHSDGCSRRFCRNASMAGTRCPNPFLSLRSPKQSR